MTYTQRHQVNRGYGTAMHGTFMVHLEAQEVVEHLEVAAQVEHLEVAAQVEHLEVAVQAVLAVLRVLKVTMVQIVEGGCIGEQVLMQTLERPNLLQILII